MASEKTILNLMLAVLMVMIGVYSGNKLGNYHDRIYIPCDEFKVTKISDLPTRCIYLLNQSK